MEASTLHTSGFIWHLVLAALSAPFMAFVINLLFVKKRAKLSGLLSLAAIATSFSVAVILFYNVWQQPTVHVQTLWFSVVGFKMQVGFWVNNLSALMLLLVTAIALPVHIYSIAYMKHDAGYTRYFTWLSFFCFAMLSLVVMDNLLLFYAFWELVGFASYLLIGFWYNRPKAVQANKKAFIMNRIGDVGLLIGIMLVYLHYHTFDMVNLFGDKALATAAIADNSWLTLPGLCFLAGAIAKSAQFPLHTWLPDAMEGPTSVSALIHAATMVAAGIFLLGRVYPMFNPTVLTVIATIGCFTAFMAATIALTQTDLKRILAYSTISQLGFMLMAMGIGAYASALLHLVTHAFFKCLLFLAAGAIIHHNQHNRHDTDYDPQDITQMGGLRKAMPVTFITCVIASMALAGLPFTSGYLSKDGILIQAFQWAQVSGGLFYLIPVGAIITSLLTAFYIARLVFKVFLGEARVESHTHHPATHPEDMLFKVPMIFLAACSLFPLFSFNPFEYEASWLYKGFNLSNTPETSGLASLFIPLIVSICAIGLIYWAYRVYVIAQAPIFKTTSFLYKLSYNQWYFNQLYNIAIVKTVLALAAALTWFDKWVIDGIVNYFAVMGKFMAGIAAWVDTYLVDGFVNGTGKLVLMAGNVVRRFQNGKVQAYLFSMLVVVLLLYVLKTFL